MKHGSLFSGIGGFDLAAEWMGWKNVFHCEWNEFGRTILKYYWPNAISYEDITKTDFTPHRGTIDILTGGFPCQPYSHAGKRLGKEDERHLWPEMLRAVREVEPTYVVGENVSGLVNWNGGLVFNEVQDELEAEGYQVQPVLLPAASVGAPHKRERVWFVAYSPSYRRARQGQISKAQNRQEKSAEVRQLAGRPEGLCQRRASANTESQRRRRLSDQSEEKRPQDSNELLGKSCGVPDERCTTANASEQRFRGESNRFREARFSYKEGEEYDWEDFPTQSPICDGDDGLSAQLDAITFSKWRKESIKGGGNAIVPQVAIQLFKTISLLNTQY